MMTRLLASWKIHVSTGFMLLAGFGCKAQAPQSAVQFDSVRQVAVDAIVSGGTVDTTAADEAGQEAAVREQLKYAVGQLNGIGGVYDWQRMTVTGITAVANDADPGHFTLTYSAQLLVSWPREITLPESITLLLPAGASQPFIDKFMDDKATAKRCLVSDAHDVDAGSAWYYYRPMNKTCEIGSSATALPEVQPVVATLAVSEQNTQGRFPEYAKIWEDGRLVVTALFGKNTASATTPDDVGIKAYQDTYAALVKKFGTPLTTTVAAGSTIPDPTSMFTQAAWQTPAGILDVEMDLVNEIGNPGDPAFIDRFNARTPLSDYIAYNGHSGLGNNIKILMGMGHYVANQYQIFLLNGCDSFAYLTNELRDAHAALNDPSASPFKYIDILTNSEPSQFNAEMGDNLAIISALVEKKKTYHDLMLGMNTRQRMTVIGEEDNADWTP